MKIRIFLMALFGFSLIGCGSEQIPTVKLAGNVTLDGKSLTEGTVIFHPADKTGGSPIAATIVDGRYLAPVVPKGSYRAAFSTQPSGTSQATSTSVTSAHAMPNMKDLKKNPIPERYRKPSLAAEATADNDSLNFELKSK
jgi:hypothetical protein